MMLEIIGAGIGDERIPSLAPFSAALTAERPS
jgi:hypothetical protein